MLAVILQMYIMFIPLIVLSLIFIIINSKYSLKVLGNKLFLIENVCVFTPLLLSCLYFFFPVSGYYGILYDLNVDISIACAVMYLIFNIIFTIKKSSISSIALPVILFANSLAFSLIINFWALLVVSTICFAIHLYITITKKFKKVIFETI